MNFTIACFLFPIVAGLNSFAINYGYKGFDRPAANARALHVAKGAAIVSLSLIVARGVA